MSGPDIINFTGNYTAEPSFRTLVNNISNTAITFALVVNDSKDESKPDLVNLIIKGIEQRVNELLQTILPLLIILL